MEQTITITWYIMDSKTMFIATVISSSALYLLGVLVKLGSQITLPFQFVLLDWVGFGDEGLGLVMLVKLVKLGSHSTLRSTMSDWALPCVTDGVLLP